MVVCFRKCCKWSQKRWIFFIFSVYSLVAVFIVPFIGKDLPFSIFYQSTPEKDHDNNIKDNLKRLEESKKTLLNYEHVETNISMMSKNSPILPEFCFVIVSVSRPNKMFFLTQVIAWFLPQLADSNSVFAVYNAEGPSHSEAVELAKYVPVIANQGKKAATNAFNKEKEDYVFALKWCSERRARFSVVIEDDGLPSVDFVSRLRFVLKNRMSYKHNWAFLKLFYPPKWQGWSNEKRIIQELVMTSLLGCVILSAFTYIVQIILTRGKSNCPEPCDLFLRCVLGFFLTLYMLLTLGRPHWLAFLGKISFHLMSVVPAPGCCTPAVLYPQEHLSDLIDYLQKTVCSSSFAMDLAIDKFATERGLEKLLVVPDLVKHIGFVSSLGKGWKNPREFRF